jgi:hypothetical protein
MSGGSSENSGGQPAAVKIPLDRLSIDISSGQVGFVYMGSVMVSLLNKNKGNNHAGH